VKRIAFYVLKICIEFKGFGANILVKEF